MIYRPFRYSKSEPIEDLNPIYADDEDDPETIIGYWKLRDFQAGRQILGGITVYNSSRRPITVVESTGDAIAILRSRKHNRTMAQEFKKGGYL